MSERRHSRRARARLKRRVRVTCGLLAITGTAVFGMASTASATTVSACASRRAVYGDTISQFVYDWGLSWRNPLDVWRVAQANPSIVNPNTLEVGEVVTDCPTNQVANLHAANFVTHGLMPGETIRTLEAEQTGNWHWPIPEWVLAQANPSLPSPDAGTPGVVVHLLPGSPPATAQAPAVVPHAPAVTVDPLPATAGAPPVRNYSPAVTTPNIPATIPPPATYEAPARDLAPPTTYEPSTTTTAVAATTAPSSGPSTVPAAAPPTPPPPPTPAAPVLPPATLPPDPPKIVEEAPTTEPSPPPAPSGQAAGGTPSAPTFGAEQPPAPPSNPSLAALADRIHSGYNDGGPDPADPAVVANFWRAYATVAPSLSPEGLSFVIGSEIQESGLDPNGPHGDGGTATGIAQWHADLGRTCGLSGQALAEIECSVTELQTKYPTAWGVLTTPGLDLGHYRDAIKTWEGYGKEGGRTKWAEGILKQVQGG